MIVKNGWKTPLTFYNSIYLKKIAYFKYIIYPLMKEHRFQCNQRQICHIENLSVKDFIRVMTMKKQHNISSHSILIVNILSNQNRKPANQTKCNPTILRKNKL